MNRSSTTSVPLRLPLALLLVACLLATACGRQEEPPVGITDDPTVGNQDGVIVDPADLERPPHSFAALPGGALTFFLPSPDARDAGAYLAADDPLHTAFQVEAEKALEKLNYDGTLILDFMAKDPGLREVWDEATSKVRVTRARPQPDGSYVVVLQADLKDVYLRVR